MHFAIIWIRGCVDSHDFKNATESMYYVPIPQAPTYCGFQPDIGGAIEYRLQGTASSVQNILWWWSA